MKDNSLPRMEYHYSLLNDRSNVKLFNEIRASFIKRGRDGVIFLYNKTQQEKSQNLKSEAFFLLGIMKCYEIKEDVYELLNSTHDLYVKYKCIVVLGWLGNNIKDVNLLGEIVKNSSQVDELRSYAVSALRQIWFKNKKFEGEILNIYKEVLVRDNDYVLDTTIIACMQDILRKKWGIIESRYGEISGNVAEAKIKALKYISKLN